MCFVVWLYAVCLVAVIRFGSVLLFLVGLLVCWLLLIWVYFVCLLPLTCFVSFDWILHVCVVCVCWLASVPVVYFDVC